MIDVQKLLPASQMDNPLYVELIDDIQNEMNKLDIPESEIINKYREFTNTQAIFEELGLSYMVELIQASGKSISLLRSFAHVIRFFKGTRFGLEFVLNILAMSTVIGTGKVVEWWENELLLKTVEPNPALRRVPNTFQIVIELVAGGLPSASVKTAFEKFLPHYVLPSFSYNVVINGVSYAYTFSIGDVNKVISGTGASHTVVTLDAGIATLSSYFAIGDNNKSLAGIAAA